MLLGFIIIYLISPKFKYLYIVIFFIGLIISFNRSAIIASIPLLFYFIYQYIKVYLANLHTSFLCNLIYPTFITLSVYIN